MLDINNKSIVSRNQLLITLVLILFFSVTSATYAYFAFSATNDTITGTAATVNLILNVTRQFPVASSDNTGVMVPQLSVSGSANSPLFTALKNGCVDGNKNVVCQVYKIDIQNAGGTATQVVDGRVDFYSNAALTTDVSSSMPNLKWKLISSVNTTTPTNSILGTNADLVADATGTDNIFSNDLSLATNASSTYYMIVWINETNLEQTSEPGESFYASVKFESSNGTGVTSTFTS